MLTDQFNRPLRDIRLSVTDKCNFRCPYCMPVEVYGEDFQFSPKAEILTFEEIRRLISDGGFIPQRRNMKYDYLPN